MIGELGAPAGLRMIGGQHVAPTVLTDSDYSLVAGA